MAVVKNIQTGAEYSDFNAAIADLPAAPWATGYELKQVGVASYTAQIAVTSAALDAAALSADTPLVLNGAAQAVIGPDAGGADYSMFLSAVSYVTVQDFLFLGSDTTANAAQLQLGEENTNAVSYITVKGCSFLNSITGAHAISIPGLSPTSASVHSSNITIDGKSDLTATSSLSSASTYPVIAASNVSSLSFARLSISQTGGSTNAVRILQSDAVTFSAVAWTSCVGRALNTEDVTGLVVVNCNILRCCLNTTMTAAHEVMKFKAGSIGVNQFDVYNNTFRLAVSGVGPDPSHFNRLIFVYQITTESFLRNNIYGLDDISAFGPFYAYEFDSVASQENLTSIGNCFHLADAQAQIAYDSVTTYATLAAWQVTNHDAASTGSGVAGSVEADPLFLDATAALSDTSPAIDIGVNTGLTTDFSGDERRVVGLLPDAGYLENQTKARGVTLSPSVVENAGGYRVTVAGLTLADGAYTVSVGPYGAEGTTKTCYAGSYGNANATTFTDGSATFVSPPLPSGGAYPLTIVSDTTALSYFVPSGFSAVYTNHQSETFGLRSVLLPWWHTGPRTIDDEDPQT